ncbi:uncharacterized protein LOC111830571 [Capsella rubella]|uniref:uncharacterized protein LOC111830571 n=1 Tax=Capsella rubella TaxID=81985 RepID=UPI000CD4CA66|nr:uncharacterized protein LOC111830571 [Capsella rubella]
MEVIESNGMADWEVSFANAAAKIGPSDLANYLEKVPDKYPPVPMFQISRFLDFYDTALPGVSCPWLEMFKDSNLPRVFDMIDASYYFSYVFVCESIFSRLVLS